MNRAEKKRLHGQIRRLPQYSEWRSSVIKKHIDDGNLLPDKWQVHHRKGFAKICKENNVDSLESALRCKELWSIKNGMVLGKGEHMVITFLERHKRPSKILIQEVENWLSNMKGDKNEMQKL